MNKIKLLEIAHALDLGSIDDKKARTLLLSLLGVSGSFSADEVDELLSTQRTNCVVAVIKYITDDEILEKIAKAPMYDYKSPNYR